MGEQKQKLGKYTLVRRIGSGGMGSVHLAQSDSGKQVALKLLKADFGNDKELVMRFRREAEFMLKLNHPNIVKAYDLGFERGRHYVCMEYVSAGNLKEQIHKESKIHPREALKIMRQISEALHYGSRRGVVHRDLKPENILLMEDGSAKLADLGLAILANRQDLRLTAPGQTLGTPSYMSPEQGRGERDIDLRSDVYSLGCTFYHAICGRPPFVDKNPFIVVQKHIQDVPPRPAEFGVNIDADIEQLLLRCLQKNRDKRFSDFESIIKAIDAILTKTEQSVQATMIQPASTDDIAPAPEPAANNRPVGLPQKTGGNKALTILLVIALLAAIGYIGYTEYQKRAGAKNNTTTTNAPNNTDTKPATP